VAAATFSTRDVENKQSCYHFCEFGGKVSRWCLFLGYTKQRWFWKKEWTSGI